MELEFGAHTIKGKKDRLNEDHHRLFSDASPLVRSAGRGQLFGVFDGMGSTPRAAEAAWHMGQSLIDFFKTMPPPAPEQIIKLLCQANQEIHGWGFVASGQARHQGACAGTVVWLYERRAYIFHAGDTRALLLRARGEGNDFDALTTDHAEGHVLHRYFGLGDELAIEQKSTIVADGDILVLMTDGVTTAMRNEEIAAQVRGWISCPSGSAGLAAQKLCELARELGSRDDITAVIVEIVEAGDDI